MKTVIIPFFDGMIARNILHTDVASILRNCGVRMVIIPPEGKGDLYTKKFSDGKTIFVESSDDVWKNSRLDSILLNIFLQSIPTRFMRIRQVDWYWHNKKYIHYGVVSVLRFLGRFKVYRWCIRKMALFQPIKPRAREIFEKWKPDAVFAPTMISGIEVALLRMAKEKGKITIGMAKSWDNFTSKAFIRVFPDWIIVHNELQIEEAVTLFDYPRDKIVVTGIPQMDHYRDASFIESKSDFCEKLGLDPDKRILLYAPAGDWMNPNDKETLEIILGWIDDGTLQQCQVLVRLHPGYHSRTEELKGRKNLVIERPGKHFGERLKSVEFEEDDMRHLASSLKHSAVVLHTASTIGMEAAYLDRPVIHIGFDGHKKLSYWKSVVRYYDREHCVPLVASGGGRLVKDADELKQALLAYLNTPSLDHEGRERLVTMLCYKPDGCAGKRLGEFLVKKIK